MVEQHHLHTFTHNSHFHCLFSRPTVHATPHVCSTSLTATTWLWEASATPTKVQWAQCSYGHANIWCTNLYSLLQRTIELATFFVWYKVVQYKCKHTDRFFWEKLIVMGNRHSQTRKVSMHAQMTTQYISWGMTVTEREERIASCYQHNSVLSQWTAVLVTQMSIHPSPLFWP